MTKPDNKQRLYELLNESATVAFDMKRNIRYMVCPAESRDLNVIWMIKSIKFTEDTPIARIRMDSPCYAESRYFVSSIITDGLDKSFAGTIHDIILARWQIESRHWVIDVAFDQDRLPLRNQDYIRNSTVYTKWHVTF